MPAEQVASILLAGEVMGWVGGAMRSSSCSRCMEEVATEAMVRMLLRHMSVMRAKSAWGACAGWTSLGVQGLTGLLGREPRDDSLKASLISS